MKVALLPIALGLVLAGYGLLHFPGREANAWFLAAGVAVISSPAFGYLGCFAIAPVSRAGRLEKASGRPPSAPQHPLPGRVLAGAEDES